LLYVREITELMSAYPGREFRMAEIVNYVGAGGGRNPRKRQAVRLSAWRALKAMIEAGAVMERQPMAARGSHALYRWR
jgi:hypothetical protein